MDETNNDLYIGPEEIMENWNVSRNKAYIIIRKLNKQLLAQKPTAIIIAGKVNKRWYEDACLKYFLPNTTLEEEGG